MEEKFGVRFLIVGSHVGDISVGGWTGVKNIVEGLKDSTDPSSSSLAPHLFPSLRCCSIQQYFYFQSLTFINISCI